MRSFHFKLILLLFLFAQSNIVKATEILDFSDNQNLNSLIQEVYVYEVPEDFEGGKITIRFGVKARNTNLYYNYVRIGDDKKGTGSYVEVLSHKYKTLDEARRAVKSYKGLLSSKVGFIKCDFSKLPYNYSGDFTCNHYDITEIDKSIDIKRYMRENNLLPLTVHIRTKAVADAINGKNTFQCEDQFTDLSKVKILHNGKEVDSDKYLLYKQGKVKFIEEDVSSEDEIYFDYNRSIKKINSFSNDLSSDISEFLNIHAGSDGEMYRFVPDPNDTSRDVLMICCENLYNGTKIARQQFSNRCIGMTYFRDRIKFYLPVDMKKALLSYPKPIDWFGLQGSWGQYGSKAGDTIAMYSGSGNAFGLAKPTTTSTDLYFHLRCRKRHCDVHTGKEHYDILTDTISTFPVKAGEWITIEREWKVGNPGLCRHTIIDSDGTHDFTVQAYNCVCDPENESVIYGKKFIGENPYNVFYPFICKLYTSSELVQHCLDKIGKCYLFFKDYELIEAQAINTFKSKPRTL